MVSALLIYTGPCCESASKKEGLVEKRNKYIKMYSIQSSKNLWDNVSDVRDDDDGGKNQNNRT